MSTPRRLGVLLCLVGAGLLVLAASQPWARIPVQDLPGITEVVVEGSRAAPAAVPVALAAAAGALVLAISGLLVRFLVAVGLTVAGAAVAVSSAQVGRDTTEALADALQESLGLVIDRAEPGGSGLGDSFNAASAQTTLWPWVGVAGALLVAASGLLVLITGRSWATVGRRFERPTEAPAPTAATSEVTARSGSPAELASTWDALSRGEDPTSAGDDRT